MGIAIKCPHCGKEVEVNPASLMGSVKTEAKKRSSRENGKLGGRPRKNKEPQK